MISLSRRLKAFVVEDLRFMVPIIRPGAGISAPYRLPYETVIIVARKHPGVIIAAAWPSLTLLLAAALAPVIIPGGGAVVLLLWVPFAASLPYPIRSVVRWFRAFFVVTSRRVILIEWRRNQPLAFIVLSQVEDLTFQRTFPARLMGYGSLKFRVAGDPQKVRTIRYLPFPGQLYLEVAALFFPSG